LFKLTTKAKNWKAVTSALVLLTEEVVLTLREEGIKCFVMDPSHTEAIGFVWEKEKFSHYEIDAGEPTLLQLQVPTLHAAFKRFPDDADVTIQTEEKAMLVTDGIKKFTCAFYINDAIDDRTPKIPYNTDFDLEISKLEDMMDDCKVFGIEKLYFESVDGKLVYSGSESPGKIDGIMIDRYPGECKRIGFNFSFMQPVLKALKTFSEPSIRVELFETAPIRLSFYITDLLTLQYYLAALDK